jgi:hypothetical protein
MEIFYLFVYLIVLGFELKALYLPGRYSTFEHFTSPVSQSFSFFGGTGV